MKNNYCWKQNHCSRDRLVNRQERLRPPLWWMSTPSSRHLAVWALYHHSCRLVYALVHWLYDWSAVSISAVISCVLQICSVAEASTITSDGIRILSPFLASIFIIWNGWDVLRFPKVMNLFSEFSHTWFQQTCFKIDHSSSLILELQISWKRPTYLALYAP